MPNGTHETTHPEYRAEERAVKFVSVGSLGEGIAGGAAVALAIVALANVIPAILAPIATIAIGAAFLLEGAAVAARYSDLIASFSETRGETFELGGVSAELIAGTAGVALGILALIGIAPFILMAIAAITFGGSLIVSSGTTARLGSMEMGRYPQHEMIHRIANEAIRAAAGLEVLVGLSAITLGILALVGLAPLTLILVALLVVGFMNFISGAAVGGRMYDVLRHR